MFKTFVKISTISILLLSQGCLGNQKVVIKGKGNIRLKQVDFMSLEGWQGDNHKKALQSFLHSCNKFAKLSQRRSIGRDIGNITPADLRDVCEIAEIVKTTNSRQTRNFFENWFRPFLVSNRNGATKGIFTGYYEASLYGSKVKTENFKYPIYAKPKDLTSAPYLTREQIENGALKGKGLELIYVEDKVELFFLHVQGSGRVTLPDGSKVKITYAGKNNRPYSSIGAYMENHSLLERGKVSAESIKKWMRENPSKADKVMNSNKSYVFFRASNDEYVIGGQGVPLTAERSLAVDRHIMPYGFPLWVDTTLKGRTGVKKPFRRLVVSQDTGSAIKGTVRGDIFFGRGRKAEEKASYMASKGEYYILLPVNIVDKLVGRDI